MSPIKFLVGLGIYLCLPAAMASPGTLYRNAEGMLSMTSVKAVRQLGNVIIRTHHATKMEHFMGASPDKKTLVSKSWDIVLYRTVSRPAGISHSDPACPCLEATHVHATDLKTDLLYLQEFPLFGGDNLLCRYPREAGSDTLPADRFDYSVVFRKGAPLH